MKTIKIKFVDMWAGYDQYDNDFVRILKKRYIVEISEKPDYIFFSVWGKEHYKYKCIRIKVPGEIETPDMNECDYVIGSDKLVFGDRYLRYPIYGLYTVKPLYEELKNRATISKTDLQKKSGFCNFVYSNYTAQEARTDIFCKLNEYKKVDSGGGFLNNIGYRVDNKRKFQEKYKFSIACENFSYAGATSEKIVDAFVAYSIPIYYGDPDIEEDFNINSFIHVRNYKSLDEMLDYIKKVDSDDDLFLDIINQSPIKCMLDESQLEEFLFHIFDQSIPDAYRRPITTRLDEIEKSRQYLAPNERMLYKRYNVLKNHSKKAKIENQIWSQISKKNMGLKNNDD